ncbi:hypothetical protein CapIbe_015979 [Capra ibex]
MPKRYMYTDNIQDQEEGQLPGEGKCETTRERALRTRLEHYFPGARLSKASFPPGTVISRILVGKMGGCSICLYL